MTTDATITFSQTGVQPPVYVTTALGGWTILEMSVDEEKTASDNLIFTKSFSGVAPGDYQYKIRLGEHHWIVDESQESATDEQGNRNNVVHVQPAKEVDPSDTPSDATANSAALSGSTPQVTAQKLPDDRKDSTMDQGHLPSVLDSLVVVDKVADKEQPTYGVPQHVDLPPDTAKRAADAEPDVEEVKADTPDEVESQESPDIPLLVVEKTDNRPAYGDDFGKDATTAQKVAHDKRTADTLPDKLVVQSESHVEPGTEEEQAAPLFRHESFQADRLPPTSSMDIIEEDSAPSSTDQTSSGDALDTPPDTEDTQDLDEFGLAPLLSHETGLEDSKLKENLTPSEVEDKADDELDMAPLLSHETGFQGQREESSAEEDELDRYPLLSHETGLSGSKGSEIVTNSDFESVKEPVQSNQYEVSSDKEAKEYSESEDGHAPLLPHERDSAVASSETSPVEGRFSLENQPTFGYETENAKTLFGGGVRTNFFRTRTNSSNLPHKMPQSDADDENLGDPSLERFPTNREQILERVASIGLQLPEDESMEDHHESPEMSVLSQACSSVDLAPVKSSVSLASVPEAEDSDGDETRDAGNLPSPVNIGQSVTRMSSTPSGLARDPHETPKPESSKPLCNQGSDAPSTYVTDSSEESVDRHDGVKDSASVLNALREAIATPTNALSPDASPRSPEEKGQSKEGHAIPVLDAQIRQRRGLDEGASSIFRTRPAATSRDGTEIDHPVDRASPTFAQQTDNGNETFLQSFIRVILGPLGRFLTACLGDRKRASVSAIALGVAITAFYFVALAS